MPHLVGDFNNWETANHDYDLIFNQNGYWEIQLDLLAGQYEYKVIESNDWDENDWPGVNPNYNFRKRFSSFFKSKLWILYWFKKLG